MVWLENFTFETMVCFLMNSLMNPCLFLTVPLEWTYSRWSDASSAANNLVRKRRKPLLPSLAYLHQIRIVSCSKPLQREQEFPIPFRTTITGTGREQWLIRSAINGWFRERFNLYSSVPSSVGMVSSFWFPEFLVHREFYIVLEISIVFHENIHHRH